MTRGATAKTASQRNAAGNVTTKENKPSSQIKQAGKPSNAPVGKGLGKAGAKRLGRLLKRVIQHQEEPPGKKKVSVPKTPVRLLKHQIQSEADSAPMKNSRKLASPRVSKLILSVVSQCKQRDGISMAELKQTLAAEGYNVTKNNRQVKVVTKRLINNETLVRMTRTASVRLNETLVRTTRNASVRLKNKTPSETRQVKTNPVKSAKPKGELKQSTTTHKLPKGAQRSKRRTKETLKSRGKSHTPKGKTQTAAKSHKRRRKPRKPAAKSHKRRRKPRKPAAKSHKRRRKPRKPAAKSHSQRAQTTKSRRKRQKPQGKSRATKKKVAKSQKPLRKAKRL